MKDIQQQPAVSYKMTLLSKGTVAFFVLQIFTLSNIKSMFTIYHITHTGNNKKKRNHYFYKLHSKCDKNNSKC